MPSFNKVILIGNLTRDPELKYTPKGTAVCRIGLAINESWKGDDGQKREKTIFLDADAWGRTAEVIGQHLKKGRPMMIEGRLKLDEWNDKQSGQKRSKLGVTVESFQFLDSGNTQGGHSAPSGTRPNASPADLRRAAGLPVVDEAQDPDIPF